MEKEKSNAVKGIRIRTLNLIMISVSCILYILLL